ncbi:MAG: nickel-responsive transcriptional regulator NikR [Methanomassiliicoccus sp.]|nr:nickel-responsive transcriptional regulator NikR [Methanomassiliicoccus sp.]
MEEITRMGISLEPELLNRFDRYIKRKGYPTRSEAFRELINEALTREALKDESTQAVGAIVLHYHHHGGSSTEKLIEAQHNHHNVISSSVHVHLDREKCLEVLIVQGPVLEVNKLSEELTKAKGVLHAGPVLFSTSSSEQCRQDHNAWPGIRSSMD